MSKEEMNLYKRCKNIFKAHGVDMGGGSGGESIKQFHISIRPDHPDQGEPAFIVDEVKFTYAELQKALNAGIPVEIIGESSVESEESGTISDFYTFGMPMYEIHNGDISFATFTNVFYTGFTGIQAQSVLIGYDPETEEMSVFIESTNDPDEH